MPHSLKTMGKKKKKQQKKDKKKALKLNAPKGCKSKCCDKYQKGEHKRCKRCPMFDLLLKTKAA